ncbi:hypothetical protein ACIGXI_12315 [Kitasatospora aureofaciens]|uniref:hypothetical protein n=1 Tax=Kitasatospora aureofaciens TaxID=1894 RepID=UPI0037CBE290
MTAIDDRMTGIFENLEVPEGVKAELIRGEIVMTAGPDMVHNLIVSAIQHQTPYARWRALQTQDLIISGEASEPQPDLVDPLKGVCVLLTDLTTDTPSGLPVYWPERTTKFGDPIRVDLLDITLDTSEFQTYS